MGVSSGLQSSEQQSSTQFLMNRFYGDGGQWSQHLHQIFGQPPMHDKEKVWGGPAPETAFLGPQIWEKKLPMKVFNQEPGWPQQHQHHGVGGGYHSAGRDSNDSTPSPPRYIEVSKIQVNTNIEVH